jgi:HPr Serine kinase C-terminal domain
MFSYRAYGLGIHAAMPLPELVAGEAEGEVTIRFGSVNHPPADAFENGWVYCRPAPGEELFSWRGAGSFLVRGGHEIVVDPSPRIDEGLLRLFVLGPVLATLLRQRGYLLLHASAIAVSGEAVLFLGSAGWGKSTMAAALHARGHRLIADDMAALRVEEKRSMVFPGVPQLRLWPEAVVSSLGDDPEKLPRWNPVFEKRVRPADDGFSLRPLPVKRVYVLAEGKDTEIVSLPSQESFVELVRHSYGSDLELHASTDAERTSHFYKCASVVNGVPVRSLRRRKALQQLPELAQLIENDLAWRQNRALDAG